MHVWHFPNRFLGNTHFSKEIDSLANRNRTMDGELSDANGSPPLQKQHQAYERKFDVHYQVSNVGPAPFDQSPFLGK